MLLTFIQPTAAPAATTMGKGLRARRRRRREARREQVAQINAQTERLLDQAYGNVDVTSVTYGADVQTGTHAGDPRFRGVPAGGPNWLLVGGVVAGGAALVLWLRR